MTSSPDQEPDKAAIPNQAADQTPDPLPESDPTPSVQSVRALADSLRRQIQRVVIGQEDVLDLLLTALLAGGHVLLEGVPGTAKTLLTQTFATALDLQFGRIQFTPDLMPGDVLGTNLFDFESNSFTLTKGPVFTEILLADEINRTPPKTQAALLQAMAEHRVTIDGVDHPLGDGFMVVATQNPIEQEGTYPLPEAQLDRFLFKAVLAFPDREQEMEIVLRHGRSPRMPDPVRLGVTVVADRPALQAVRQTVTAIDLSRPVAALLTAVKNGLNPALNNPTFLWDKGRIWPLAF